MPLFSFKGDDMRFKGTPFSVVIDSKTKRAIAKFDENGILDTDEYTERLKRHFEVVEPKKCKKCNAEFYKHGDLLAHYKKEHPK